MDIYKNVWDRACVNTKLRKKKKKLDDGQTVGSKGRLTKVVIDKLENYYGAAITGNIGNLRIMQDAIWAIFYHTIKASNETLDVQHQYCPKGSKSWCKYQLDVANETNFYTQDNCLPHFLQDCQVMSY